MALMTEERRKEMEEEMSRFEQEIAVPDNHDLSSLPPGVASKAPPAPKVNLQPDVPKKPRISPPPSAPNLLPSVLCKPPPPPPPPSSTPPPPTRPLLPPPMPPGMHPQAMAGTIRFIPHQLQRQPLRPPMRPNFMPMRGPPGFQPQGPMPPFSPGPLPPHMHPPQMHHPGMPPMGMPMPPGFCPPGPPMNHMGGMNPSHQNFMPPPMVQTYNEQPIPSTKKQSSLPKESQSEPVIESAPAVYAAPPKKSRFDKVVKSTNITNGQSVVIRSITTPVVQKIVEFSSSVKTVDKPSGITTAPAPVAREVVVNKKKEKKKKFVRMAGGQAWEDNSLLDWDSDDFRLFCGDLGNEVTDDVLIRAFNKYESFVKAKVIYDKRASKTKGYGFVSFKDPQDYIKAMREMNGKYVGSRPIKLRKSTWKDRNIDVVKTKQKEKEKFGLL